MEFIKTNIYYLAAFFLISLGLYAIFSKRNLIKIIIGITIIDTGVNLFLIAIGYVKGKSAPVVTSFFGDTSLMVDPLVQALVLTAIVIGVSVIALALSFAVNIYRHFNTLDVDKIKELRW